MVHFPAEGNTPTRSPKRFSIHIYAAMELALFAAVKHELLSHVVPGLQGYVRSVNLHAGSGIFRLSITLFCQKMQKLYQSLKNCA